MKKSLFLIFALVFVSLSAGEAFACSCLMDTKTPVRKQVKNSFQGATAVFYGEVLEVDRASGVKVRFRVERSWKGPLENEAIVYTMADSAMCGYNFETGRKYLVYASGETAGLSVSLCSRTSPSNADAKYLNKIKKPKIFGEKPKAATNK